METVSAGPGQASAPKKAFVLPGEQVGAAPLAAGSGTYAEGGRIFASILGIRVEYRETVNVVPLSGIYHARQGDTVIGNVIDLGPSNWTIDIKASSPAPLHVNDVPWKVDFGDTARYIAVGETVMCKVLKIDEVKRVFLTLAGPGLRKLEGGEVVETAPTKIGRVVGRGGATIEKLKKWTNCRIFAATNGRVWVDGELSDMVVAIGAIKLIEREADSPKLSAILDDFLKKHGREPAVEAPAQSGFQMAAPGEARPGFSEAMDEEEERRRERRAHEEE